MREKHLPDSSVSVLCMAIVVLLAAASDALAASSSWSRGMGARLRLIAPGSPPEDGAFLAGVHIELNKGWKTYWKVPGDTGIPPQFDFSASMNVNRVEILYPLPRRDDDGRSVSLIYKDTVVFPLRVIPQVSGAPVILKLKAVYGACETICVPETAAASLMLTGGSSTDVNSARLLTGALLKVPGKRSADQAARGLGVQTVTHDPGRRSLDIAVSHASGQTVDLLVAGPQTWYIGIPERLPGKGNPARFRLSVSGIPKTATLKGTRFVFTVIDGEAAYEQAWTVD